MYVLNFKLNSKKILIILGVVLVIAALFIEITNKSNEKENTFDYVLTETNFTSILKTVHDNIDENVGKTIKLSGFIFKLPDFNKENFVCGRNMILDNDEKVVGFLCSYNGDFKLTDACWVEIEGVIVKGFYKTDMPVIEVKEIKGIPAPANTFVETPDFL